MRVIVCGSRDWTDYDMIRDVLRRGVNHYGVFTVVHGGARGADALAGIAARSLGLPEEEHPADWRGRGKIAGPERNRLMLDLGADRVVAFKNGFDPASGRGGTENMVKIAQEAGVPVSVYPGVTRDNG